jgi:hypothetical protein
MEGQPRSVDRQLRIPYRYNVIWNNSWYRRALKQRDRVSRSFDHGALKQREAVVKRAYVELRERAPYLKRLAFRTIRAEEAAGASELFQLTGSKPQDIDVHSDADELRPEYALSPLQGGVRGTYAQPQHPRSPTGRRRPLRRSGQPPFPSPEPTIPGAKRQLKSTRFYTSGSPLAVLQTLT